MGGLLREGHIERPDDHRADRFVVGVLRWLELDLLRPLERQLVETVAELVEQHGRLDLAGLVDDQSDPDHALNAE